MKLNTWYISSFLISLIVAIPILTVFSSFFQETTNYFEIIKNTFLYEYIFNSLTLLIGVLILTLIIGVGCAYIVSFYHFTGVKFFKWALILSFAVPAYIYAYSLTAFFENYGTLYSLIKLIFGDGYEGSKVDSPFDAVIITAAPDEIPKSLIQQLKIHGRMIMPLNKNGKQILLRIKNTPKGIIQKEIDDVLFVPMLKGIIQ